MKKIQIRIKKDGELFVLISNTNKKIVRERSKSRRAELRRIINFAKQMWSELGEL